MNRLGKIRYVVLILLFAFIGCNNGELKYLNTEKLVGNIYLEKYSHGKYFDYYLTDSIHYKYYIGKTNPENNEVMRYDVFNGKVVVKVYQRNSDKNTEVLLAMDTYNMKK